MHQVEGEDHDQVANGDHFKVAVDAVAQIHKELLTQMKAISSVAWGGTRRHQRSAHRDGLGDERQNRDFLESVVKALHFHCGGSGSIPGPGN